MNIVSSCANCGKGGEQSGKLKNCAACMMVKYCSRDCQIAHRPQHKKACKKRVAELHDEELFKQPPPQDDDCPICFQKLPVLNTGRRYQSCCGKEICAGCEYAPVYDNQGNVVDNQKCPFCRTPFCKSREDMIARLKKREEAGDRIAIYNMGNYYRDGRNGFPQNHTMALECYHRAAQLGHALAYNDTGYCHEFGRGVEVDKKKANHYYEIAAIGGDVVARHNLGINEKYEGNMDRALKHFMISVGCGDNHSLEMIQKLYSNGLATKDDYRKALHSYQTYLSEIKSVQRDKAAAAHDGYRYY